MGKPFTEEQKQRFKDHIVQHEARFHNGEVTHCTYHSECHKTERAEWAEQDRAAREVKSNVG